jgi:hypothetical protein
MLTGLFGTCNLCLGGNQNGANMWTSCQYNGFFTRTFMNCSQLCLFYNNCNYELSDAIYPTNYPKYNTSHGLPFSNFGMNEVYNKNYPFNWNFRATTGIGTLQMTSPFSITRFGNTGVIYGCEAVQFSSISTTATVSASPSTGYNFTSWRINSSSGNVASLNASFSPIYNGSYKGNDYRNIWQFYATATLIPVASSPSVTTTSTAYISKGSRLFGFGDVTSDGGATVTARGFVVGNSSNTNPTLTNYTYLISGGSGTGTYNAETQVLVPIGGTTFYVRAYATNSVGTGYGTALSQVVL